MVAVKNGARHRRPSITARVRGLKSSNYGCHVGKLYVGFIAYIDDLILFSAYTGTL